MIDGCGRWMECRERVFNSSACCYWDPDLRVRCSDLCVSSIHSLCYSNSMYSVGSENELLWPLFLSCSYFGLGIYHIQMVFTIISC